MNFKEIHYKLRSINHTGNKYLQFTSIPLIQSAVDNCNSESDKKKLMHCISRLQKMDLEKDLSLIIREVSLAESIIENLK